METVLVTEIVPITNSRSKVYIDNEFAFVLYKGELRNYKITEGKDIDRRIYDEILVNVLPKRAKLRGMSLLKSRPYTEKQMYDKLKQGGYPDTVADIAIEYFKSFGYIDDLRYARDYIDYYSEGRSRKRLEQDLLQKGIGRADIREAFDNWHSEGGVLDELAQIKELLIKKSYSEDTADIKEKQKIMAFLFRKGFSSDNIRKALNCDELS